MLSTVLLWSYGADSFRRRHCEDLEYLHRRVDADIIWAWCVYNVCNVCSRWSYGGDSFQRRCREVWDSGTVVCTQTFFGHGALVHPAVVAADGATELTASENGAAETWDACNGECTQTLSGHDWCIFSAVFFSRWSYGVDSFRRRRCEDLECL